MAGTHYIALAVKPAEDAGDSGDFHFWRLDDNKVWSYKVGMDSVAARQSKPAAAKRSMCGFAVKFLCLDYQAQLTSVTLVIGLQCRVGL